MRQVLLCVVFALWLTWLVAAEEVDHKVTLLVYCVLACLVGSRTAVRVEGIRWNDREAGEYCWVPLNNVFLIVLANILHKSKEAPYQSMSIRALEVIRAVQWIEPSVQQELRPIALAEEEARRCQSVLVLRQNEVDLLALEMLEGSDDTFWWNDRLTSKHCLVQHLWLHNLLLDVD